MNVFPTFKITQLARNVFFSYKVARDIPGDDLFFRLFLACWAMQIVTKQENIFPLFIFGQVFRLRLL